MLAMDTSQYTVLDHYYIETSNGCLGVVVGNWHSQYFIIGYIKYCPSSAALQPWKRGPYYYNRVVKTYSAEQVHASTSWRVIVPFFGSAVPCIPVSLVKRVYCPLDRSLELYSQVKDSLEGVALELVNAVSLSSGVVPGLTGSLLPGIHNPELSDVDLVVYGARESVEVVESIEANRELFRPFTEERLKDWALRVAQSTGLSTREVLKYYRNWRRGLFRGREYSVIYSDGIYREVLTMPAYESVGIVKMLARISGGLEALNYPSMSRIESYRLVEFRGRIPYEIGYLMSYEAVYIPGLYEGGSFEVDGLVQCSMLEESCRVTLGAVEYRGSLRWLDAT